MKVSIIIPFFNAQDYIERALKSAYNQTYKPIEVICVDNNSTDNSLKLVKELQKNYYEDLQILSESNQGASAARNKGLKHASGEWIQFLDSDDEIVKTKIEKQVQIIINSSFYNLGLVGGAWKEIGLNKQSNLNQNYSSKWISLFDGTIGNTCSVLIKKEALNQVNGWNTELKSSQERNLFFEIMKKGYQVEFLDEPLTIIHKRENSITTNIKNQDGNITRFVDLKFRVLKHLIKNENQLYLKHNLFFNQTMFSWIHILFQTNPSKSLEYYNQIFPKKLILKPEGVISKWYAFMYSIFGFYFTEKIYSFLRRNKK